MQGGTEEELAEIETLTTPTMATKKARNRWRKKNTKLY
jgi:hypothetical protein